MKYMCLIYEDESHFAKMSESEKDVLYGDYYNSADAIKRSGHHIAGDPLLPTPTATTVRVRNGKTQTTDGPFAETKELIAGFWMFQVRSKEEAIEWVKRCPNPHPGHTSEIEIRQVFDADDFGAEFTPELRAREERLVQQMEANKKK